MNSEGAKSIGSKLLQEGEREIQLPEDCSVMGVLDDMGESSDSNYIGAQRREQDYAIN